jgi:GxxExxY protein
MTQRVKGAQMTEQEANKICDKIRQIAYDLLVYLGVGYLEKVYENGLAHRLTKAGMAVQSQVPIQVADEDGFVIGEYVADMVVDGIIIELKSVSTLLQIHIAQLLNYMKAMKLEHGLLINFGSEKFQCKKVAKSL